ncbi:zinc ribbon domain-containing protein [Vibrio rumoiensis]|uniref:Zinc ribbon domain-containing protein n=1 Tax=Vibrio rumoiensis TaxID=76258 RepID=A0ABW7IU65_9VIBR|nr:zinc ribbon domain-containing protein [Vibrio rumoiensis]
MNKNECSCCEGELVWNSNNKAGKDSYQCQVCNLTFNQLAFCPDCKWQAEKIQACGAVSYFCPNCNELKSKSRITFQYQKNGA